MTIESVLVHTPIPNGWLPPGKQVGRTFPA